LEWGLITDVQPPEFETRLAILRMKADSERLENIPDEVLAFIASNIEDNVRELEGALIRIAAYSSLHRTTLDETVAKQVLADLKLSGYRLGFLINFHVDVLKNGIRRFVNQY
jgi:chromosomal replication initiator protein